MGKSVYSNDYKIFLARLRSARMQAGLTQEDLAKRLGQTQSFVSKCERGERRLDVVELKRVCDAIGLSLAEFIEGLVLDLESDAFVRNREFET